MRGRSLGLPTGALGRPRTMSGYEVWLRSQSDAQQAAILGRGKAALFRSGTITLADLLDADTRVVSLRELRTRFGLDRTG